MIRSGLNCQLYNEQEKRLAFFAYVRVLERRRTALFREVRLSLKGASQIRQRRYVVALWEQYDANVECRLQPEPTTSSQH